MQIRVSFAWFAGAYMTLLFVATVLKYLVPLVRNVSRVFSEVQQLRRDVAALKRAQGVRLSRAERRLLEEETDDDQT